jgi:aerobic-type carbon monoxide dehydrogenase small subunit (CoxS/CutS family)
MPFRVVVNGRLREVDAAGEDSLLAVLRDDLKLTGSKFGCGEGYCGACTVLLGGQPVRSCVTRLASVGDRPVTTVEALETDGKLHPVQQAFLEVEAFQCGYCTPGMIMATIGLLEATSNPTDADIARVMDRNVCRCGEFPRIVKAIKLAVERVNGGRRG